MYSAGKCKKNGSIGKIRRFRNEGFILLKYVFIEVRSVRTVFVGRGGEGVVIFERVL